MPTESYYIAIQQAEGGSVWQTVEQTKQYSYFIETADGWKINTVTFNGTELTIAANGFVKTPAVSSQYNRLIVTYEQETTAIENVPAAQLSQVKVLGSAEGIHITNAKIGDQVAIYDMNGRMVYTQKMQSHQADIALKQNNLYIIKVADKVMKVKL